MPDSQQDLLALAHELTRRVLENPREKGRIIKDFHAEQVAAHNAEAADFALNMYSIHLARGEPGANLPMLVQSPRKAAKMVHWPKMRFVIGLTVVVGICSYFGRSEEHTSELQS